MYILSDNRSEKAFEPKHPPLSDTEALIESNRCINCYDAPCVQACPTHINIPQFIKRIHDENLSGSAQTILESNILGYSCSKVCPVEVLCEGSCVYNLQKQPPIQIGRLQRYAMEYFFQNPKLAPAKHQKKTFRVALIGAGPASLSCAAYLTLSGVSCTIFEKNPLPGGLNVTGVAPYKLFADEALQELSFIQNLGIEIQTNVQVGKDISFQKLQNDYHAVFLGIGLSKDRFLFESQNIRGVRGAIEIIEEIKLKQAALSNVKHAIIIGGGNTALDIAHELAVLGNFPITLAYRKSKNEMSGYKHEREPVLASGVSIIENAIPVAIETDDTEHVCSVVFDIQHTRVRKFANLVIFAIGQEKHDFSAWIPDLRCHKDGRIKVSDKTYETSIKNVFAGGDSVNGGKEVVNAVAEGREAAYHILKRFGLEVAFGRFNSKI